MPQQPPLIDPALEDDDVPTPSLDLSVTTGAPLTVVEKQPLAVVEEQPLPPEAKMGALGRGLAGFWEQINPITMVQGAVSAVADIPGTVRNVGAAQGELYARAARAFQKGDYVTGARHAINYLIPLLGPAMDEQANKAAAGDIAGAVGGTFGLAAATLGPKKLAAAGGVTPLMKPVNAMDAAANTWGAQRGIALDAATATGNRFVRGAQGLADRTIGGSILAEKAAQQTAQDLTRVGREIADVVHPTSVSPEQAGLGVRTAIEGKIKAFDATADVEYGKFRQVEQSTPKTRVQVGTKTETLPDGTTKSVPVFEDIALPVDIRKVRAMLRPIYDRMRRQMPITILKASQGFKSLENIIKAKDYLPASIAERDLSTIKSLARGADMPELRSASQGLAAGAVRELQTAIDDAVRQAGGQSATDALAAGRAATKAKYNTAKVLKAMREEPVQVFNSATWRQDSGIAQLRRMAKEAPGQMAQLGRAYLDDMLATATAEGGFSRSASLASKWQQLGPETKKLLFGKNTADLDKFFHLAKRLHENPNPSGSAFVGAIGAQGLYLFYDPLTGVAMQIGGAAVSRMLRSQAAIRALTQGMQIRLGNKGAAAITAAQIARLAGKDAVPVGAPTLVPVTEQDSRTSQTPSAGPPAGR